MCLVFVEVGSDWCSFNWLVIEDGNLWDYFIVLVMFCDGLGVRDWEVLIGIVGG